jgi:hypothetical protein
MGTIDRHGRVHWKDEEPQAHSRIRMRNEVAAHAFAEFENSKTLRRAREAVRHDASPEMLKALEQAEAGWERAMNKIASVPVGRVLFRRDTRVDT